MSAKIAIIQEPHNGWCVRLDKIDGQPVNRVFGIHVTTGHPSRAAATRWWVDNRAKVLALYEERVLKDARKVGAFQIVRRHAP